MTLGFLQQESKRATFVLSNRGVKLGLALKQIFSKTKSFFKKVEYRFLVKATKIEHTSFSLKTALSEVNVKTNRMATIKQTYHKECSFASNYFIFLEDLLQF